jgi:hypothetical protein
MNRTEKSDKMRTRIVFPTVVATALICASLSYGREGGLPGGTPPPIDATLYTKYNPNRAHTSVGWTVCGSLPGSSGCYGSGSLGPYGMVGGVMEGEPTTDVNQNTVTRAIYVLDIATGPNGNGVVLYVYTKVDAITTDSDTVTVTLSQTISLPLVSGTLGYPAMAANNQFLFIGTQRSPYAVQIDKQTFSVTQLGGFNPPINVYGITADEYGYVTVSFGAFNTRGTAFIVVGPDGSAEETGNGSQVMLNTNQAVKITTRAAGIQTPQNAPVQAGISDPLRVRRNRSRHDQEGGLPGGTPPPIDATLYTKYNLNKAHTSVNWNVCGSLPGSSGCYGSGSLGPYGKAGALLEGEPTTDVNQNTVTRAIYVLDSASGPNQNEVVLYVYTKVDTITTDSDTVTVTLSQTISLPLVGGLSTLVPPSMAANNQFLFIGTDGSPYAVEIDKQTFSVTQVGGGFNPPINVFGILGDQYGYVSLLFGSPRSSHTGFDVFGPDGSIEETANGSQFLANIVDGVLLRP